MVISFILSRTSDLLLQKLSIIINYSPFSKSSAYAWFPIYPSPPFKRINKEDKFNDKTNIIIPQEKNWILFSNFDKFYKLIK